MEIKTCLDSFCFKPDCIGCFSLHLSGLVKYENTPFVTSLNQTKSILAQYSAEENKATVLSLKESPIWRLKPVKGMKDHLQVAPEVKGLMVIHRDDQYSPIKDKGLSALRNTFFQIRFQIKIPRENKPQGDICLSYDFLGDKTICAKKKNVLSFVEAGWIYREDLSDNSCYLTVIRNFDFGHDQIRQVREVLLNISDKIFIEPHD